MQYAADFDEVCDILLLDAPTEALPGGNGKKFDWNIMAPIYDDFFYDLI